MARTISVKMDNERRQIDIEVPGGFEYVEYLLKLPDNPTAIDSELLMWVEDVSLASTGLSKKEISQIHPSDMDYFINQVLQEFAEVESESSEEQSSQDLSKIFSGKVNLDEWR